MTARAAAAAQFEVGVGRQGAREDSARGERAGADEGAGEDSGDTHREGARARAFERRGNPAHEAREAGDTPTWSPWLPWYARDVGLRRRAHLPVALSSPRGGRHFVGATLADWQLWGLADHAMTCTSELVTNAVRHARWPEDPAGRRMITVAVAQLVGAVVVEVWDLDPRPPVFKPRPDLSMLSEELSELAEGGAGLRVVAGLTDEFGIRPLREGKSLWFLLRTSRGTDPPGGG